MKDDDRIGMKVVVASGKGGTGKTLVAANLATVISEDVPVTLLDCDVEEPNLHLFFPGEEERREVSIGVPVFDADLCTRCGECSNFCRYGAILVARDRILFFPELCHSCGGCMRICPNHAIKEVARPIGHVCVRQPARNLRLVYGVLNEGEVLSPVVIREVKKTASEAGVQILDAPPGTSCPVVEAMDGCDACILVTESTPFGEHDLALALQVARMLKVPAGVVINRSDGDDREMLEFCRREGLPVLLIIPFDRKIAELQNQGMLYTRAMPERQGAFRRVFTDCLSLAEGRR